MKTGIGKWLQIDTGNRPMILALLIQAGATGVFAALLELAGNALFLESYPADQIPLAIMVSGAAGIFIASIYSYFSKQLEVKSFGILNLVAVVVIAASLLVASFALQKSRFDFLLFILMAPLLLITLMGFRTTVAGFLSPSRGKELYGLIEGALIGGLVLAFILGPLPVRSGMQLKYLLFPGLGSLVLAAGAQVYVLMGMNRSTSYSQKRVSSTGPIRLFSHRYTGLISTFVLLGVCVSMVLHFTFLWSAGDQFRGQSQLVSFLGFFFGSMVLLSWIMKRTLFSLIKRKFGSGVVLLLSPILIFVLSMAAAITGDLSGMNSPGGILPVFLWLVFLSRFFYGIWTGSFQEGSLNLICQTLDPREKNNVKSGIEGVLSQIGVFTIGLFLACFVLISFQMIHVIYFLVLLVMAWFFVGLSLYRNYRKFLKISLESDRIRDRVDLGLHDLSRVDLQKTAFPVETLEFNPYLFHYTTRDELIAMLDHAHPGVRLRVWDHMLESSHSLPQLTLSQMLSKEHEPQIKERIRAMSRRKLRSKLGLQEAFIRERLDRFSDTSSEVDPAINEAFQSGERNEVFAALYHVAREKDRTYLPEVVSLLKEADLEVRSVAISTAGNLDSRRVTARLIENLEHKELYSLSWSALVCQGELVLEELEATFHKAASDVRLQKRIISIFAAIGGEKAMQLLVDKLDYHQREVFSAVVRGLYENHFQANDLQEAAVSSAILRLVNTGSWDLAAKISIRMENPGGYLDQAIDQEIWEVNSLIMMLLALVYDRRSVQRIRLNLLDKYNEDRGMGLELLDLLLKDPLKSVLIAYFHDVLIREKIDKLPSIDRVDLIPVELLLRKILNRDGMQMGDFIRLCVLERMGNHQGNFDEQQIIAQGFHPNPKIRETAAQLLRKNDPGRFDMVTERLDFPDNSFPDHEDLATWYSSTTINLAAWKLFKNVGINNLFKLVSVLQPYSESKIREGDFVVLARIEESVGISPLSNGIAFIAALNPEILEQIRYLGEEGASEVYLVEREEFIELLFDDRSLLHVLSAFLGNSGELMA
jgi:hypothetical protein